ncbi:hypothetical protein [Bradymonas sediminis]|nr:hypothetical protein [Bradymonas sediminis]TDP75694.1 hypothetical protein DFR33_10333 [Bradymonas sediminis]
MAKSKRRKKPRTTKQKNQDARGRRFIITLIAVTALFILGFIALRLTA